MSRIRQYVVFLFIIALLLSLFTRLFYLQILNFGKYSKIAAEQHNLVFEIQPKRGGIVDRFLDPIAVTLDVPSIYCNPREVSDKEETAEVVSGVLAIDKNIILEKLNKDKAFVWLKRKIDTRTETEIKKLNLTGIYIRKEPKRSYPNGSLASHIIGFAGTDNKGLEGIELLFDEKLRGKSGFGKLVRDAKRCPVFWDERESVPPQNGYNLVLTLDNVIQYIVEEELKAMVLKFNASGASIVVMEPFSGKILAMANYPDYDLNSFSEAPEEILKNTAVSSVYEPGSVFKIVTLSAVLSEGIISLDDEIYCEKGNYKVEGRILHDYHGYGKLSFREVIVKSSNIGVVKAALKLGPKRLYEYIKKFGFGEITGIDLPGEVNGISRIPAIWSRSDITTIPIGQGIAVTPIQLACAISVIANNGYLMKPYLVDKITTWEGDTYKEFNPVVKRKVLTEEVCKKAKGVLKLVVTNGTGTRAKSGLYEIGGKTGTAQMVKPEGGYYPDKYNATFIGFAPVDVPEVSIVIVARNPHPVYFGGSVAAPTFKNIAERVLQYLENNRVEVSCPESNAG